MPADPTPAPEWAVNAAKDYFGRPHVAWTKAGERGYFPDLARLLASVRDAALREAADRCNRLDVVLPSCSAPVRRAADKCRDAILSLVGTAPKPTESAPVSEASEEPPHAR